MARKGTVAVKFVGDISGLEGALNKVDGKFSKLSAGLLGVGAAVGTAVVAVGAGLVNLGRSFDQSFDKIRVGTGATGEALQRLQGDFKQVLRSTATDFDSASTAVADLNTRLGLTGKPLQALSKQFIDMSRITGTDLSQNVANITRVFGDWAIETDKQSGALDAVFRAAQATGAGIDRLTQQVVQFGAPLRQMGFGFEESIALLGKFEKEGVNTELVMGSLRIALGRMAKAGEEPIETFQRVLAEIQALGPGAQATGLAIEVFGQRAGPDMAAAITEGRFALGELLNTIASGDETIAKATADTEDFSEKWQIFKNKVLVGLEPLASGAFNAINSGMDTLGGFVREHVMPHLERFGTYLRDTALPAIDKAAEKVKALVEGALEDLRKKIEENRPQLEQIVDVLEKFARLMIEQVIPAVIRFAGPALSGMIGAIGIAVSALGLLVTAVEKVVAVFQFLFDLPERMRNLGRAIVEGLINGVRSMGGPLRRALGDVVGDAISSVPGAGLVKNLVPKFHTGGMFRAPVPGGEGLALLQDGETVLPRGARLGGAAAGFGPITINVNGAQDPAATAREVRRELLRLQRRNGSTGL